MEREEKEREGGGEKRKDVGGTRTDSPSLNISLLSP